MKLTKNRFTIAKSLIGQNAIITFTNKKGETYTYDHDAIYSVCQEKFETMECFQKYGNYTNSNKLPKFAQLVMEQLELVNGTSENSVK